MKKNTTKRNILPALLVVVMGLVFLCLILINVYHSRLIKDEEVVEKTITIDEIRTVSEYRRKDSIAIHSSSKVYYVKNDGNENEYSLDELMQVLEVGDTITIKYVDAIEFTIKEYTGWHKEVLEIREGDQYYRSLEVYRRTNHRQAMTLPASTAVFIFMWLAVLIPTLWIYRIIDFPLKTERENRRKKEEKKKAKKEKAEEETYKTGDKTGDEGAPS